MRLYMANWPLISILSNPAVLSSTSEGHPHSAPAKFLRTAFPCVPSTTPPTSRLSQSSALRPPVPPRVQSMVPVPDQFRSLCRFALTQPPQRCVLIGCHHAGNSGPVTSSAESAGPPVAASSPTISPRNL